MPKGKGYKLAKQYGGKVKGSKLANSEKKGVRKFQSIAKKAGK